jgi:hypothetical protein
MPGGAAAMSRRAEAADDLSELDWRGRVGNHYIS